MFLCRYFCTYFSTCISVPDNFDSHTCIFVKGLTYSHRFCSLAFIAVSLLCSPSYLSLSRCRRWSPIELISPVRTAFPHWLMTLSPHWQLLSRSIWTSQLPTATPPSWQASRPSLLVFLKCQRQSRIGQDNKHLNKALSLINERWWGREGPPDCLAQILQWLFCK